MDFMTEDETVIKLDNLEMEMLSEFPAEKTAYENAQEKYGADFYRIGLQKGFIIVAAKNEVSESDLEKRLQTIKNGNERQKFVIENWMKRDWWSVRLVFETGSCKALIERLEEVYGLKPSKEFDLNKSEIMQGGDEMGVRMNSVMPHNAGRPIETLQIVNHRPLKVDGLDSDKMWQLITTPETGRKLLDELQNLKSAISDKSAE